MSKNLDQDPSGEFDFSIPSPPLPKETQEYIFTCIKKGYQTDDLQIVRQVFEEMYGYKPSI